ncbi:MAG TPA: hypothetical protein V6D26_15585, partial [Stenomitos sp.]
MGRNSRNVNGKPGHENVVDTRNRPSSLNPDIARVRAESEPITQAVNSIAGSVTQMAEGLDLQMRSLEETISGANEMAASLKETAGQAESVATS